MPAIYPARDAKARIALKSPKLPLRLFRPKLFFTVKLEKPREPSRVKHGMIQLRKIRNICFTILF